MQPLIDSDILVYEIGSIGQWVDDDGNIVPRSWNFVQNKLDEKIELICKAVGASKPPKLFLTDDSKIHEQLSKRTELPQYIPNFRTNVAITKPYKGTRNNEKPYHTDNIKHYLYHCYDTELAMGCEADDLLASRQEEDGDTVICSRDKDLRMVPGWHYGWECGKQEEFPLTYYDTLGTLSLDTSKSIDKIVGGGYLFYASQMLTGDVVDNIPGLPKCGVKGAYEALKECDSVYQAFRTVVRMYKTKMEEGWKDYFLEQHQLLWMRRDL